MRVEVVGQRGERLGHQRGHHQSQSAHEHDVDGDDRHQRRVRPQRGEHPQRRRHRDGARDHQRSRAHLVEQGPHGASEEAEHQAAGQDGQPADERAGVEHGLQVERQQDGRRAQQAHEQQRGQHQRHGEAAVGERAQVEQGPVLALEPGLAQDEHREGECAEHDRYPRRHEVLPARGLTDGGQAVEHAAEAQCGQQHRQQVQRHRPRRAVQAQPDRPEHERGQRQREDRPEHPAPAQRGQHRPADRGAHRRGDGDDDGDRAHGGAAPLGRDQAHHRGHQQRDHHRRATGLDHPAGQQYPESRCQRAEQRPQAEQRQRGQKDLAWCEPFEQEARCRDDHRHRQQESAGQPLHRRGRHPQFDAEVAQGDAEDRLVEDHHEGRDDQNPDQQTRPWRRGSLVGFRRGRARGIDHEEIPLSEVGSLWSRPGRRWQRERARASPGPGQPIQDRAGSATE